MEFSCFFYNPISSVQFSRSVMSDSLQPHELQHARPPCPSPTPGVHPNSCPLSQWCHPSSHIILCHLLLLLPPIPPSIRVFSNESCVGNLISGSSFFSKSSLNIWEFLGHVLLKPHLENFEHYMWDESNCVVVWTVFIIVLLWYWNENCPFPVLWPLLSFPNLLAYWV